MPFLSRPNWVGARRFALFLAFFIAAAPACAPRGTPPADQGSTSGIEGVSNARLVEEFGKLALGEEWSGGLAPRLHKWIEPVRVGLSGIFDDELERRIADHLAELARLTGHDIAFARNAEINFEIRFAPTDAPAASLDELYSVDPFRRRWLQRANCFFVLRTNASGEITEALAVVSPDLPKPRIEHCLVEEISQALGLPNDDDTVAGSIFNDRSERCRLSEKDMFFLRVLYHPAMRPGMSRSDALATARRIIVTLRPEGGE